MCVDWVRMHNYSVRHVVNNGRGGWEGKWDIIRELEGRKEFCTLWLQLYLWVDGRGGGRVWTATTTSTGASKDGERIIKIVIDLIVFPPPPSHPYIAICRVTFYIIWGIVHTHTGRRLVRLDCQCYSISGTPVYYRLLWRQEECLPFLLWHARVMN